MQFSPELSARVPVGRGTVRIEVGLRRLGFVLWAAMIALALFQAAEYANSTYYQRWPLQGDTASYFTRDMELLKAQEHDIDHRVQALRGALQNRKDPIRTAVYALLPEDTRSSINGHLYFSGFAAFVFVLLSLKTVWARTGSATYAAAVSVVALMPSGLLHPLFGLPSRLPDLPASLLFGAAMFAMFCSSGSRRSERTWLLAAGLLLGLATLSRYQLWIYGLFSLVPIAVIFGLRRYLEEGRRVVDLVAGPFTLLVGFGLVAGAFVLHWSGEMFRFYSVAGYALGTTVVQSVTTTGHDFLVYLGIGAALGFALIFAGYISTRERLLAHNDWWDSAAIIWALVAYPILLFVIMRVESIVEQSYYIVPGLALFSLAPFVRSGEERRQAAFRRFAVCLLVVLPLSTSVKVYEYLKSEAFLYPREGEARLALFQHKLAEQIAVLIPSSGAYTPPTVDTNFFYYGRYIVPLLQSKFDRRSTPFYAFQIRESQWRLSYTGDEQQDRKLVMETINDKVDIFSALTKPNPGAKMSTFVDDYTESVAMYVNEQLAANTDVWENRGNVTGPFGEVTVYKKRVGAQ